MRRSLVALTAATTIAVAAVATSTTADARWRAAAGGGRRSAASPLARSSEAPSHGPITRIRITDMATATRPIATAIRPTATAIRPTGTATHHLIIDGTAAPAASPSMMPDRGPQPANASTISGKRPRGD